MKVEIYNKTGTELLDVWENCLVVPSIGDSVCIKHMIVGRTVINRVFRKDCVRLFLSDL